MAGGMQRNDPHQTSKVATREQASQPKVLPGLEFLLGAFGLGLIAGSVRGKQQLFAAFEAGQGRVDSENVEPLASALLGLAEFAFPVVRRVTGDSNIGGLAYSILFVHWGLLALGAGRLIVPHLLLRRRTHPTMDR